MSDAGECCLDDVENWLMAMEDQAVHSPLVYYVPDEAGQRALYDLCQCYLQASEQQRALIRNAVSDKRGVLNHLMGYIYKSAEQVRATRERMWLRIGAAAAAIQGGRLDYRDFLLALAELYVTAEEAELDPQAEFQSVGNLPEDFHTYAVVRSRRGR